MDDDEKDGNSEEKYEIEESETDDDMLQALEFQKVFSFSLLHFFTLFRCQGCTIKF